MSRAFVKEDDAGDNLPELPVPVGPNYVTPRGFDLLKQEAQRLMALKRQAKSEDDGRPWARDLRYIEARMASAVIVPAGSGDEIRFGVCVTLEDDTGHQTSFTIVGEDEARTDIRFLSWSAPLVSELFGLKVGDKIFWDGPEGKICFKVAAVSYV